MVTTASDILTEYYTNAMTLVGSSEDVTIDLSEAEITLLKVIVHNSEGAKGVMTVFITSLVYKLLNPQQDIRNHQDSIPLGYSGRTFDNRYITPFLKQCKFPAMAESGWLTRSLEQKTPYTLDYTGAITPQPLKIAFLALLDRIQREADCKKYLSYILQGLIIKRNKHRISLSKPTTLSITSILDLLDKHFNGSYVSEGASRLPVLAFYAIYQCLIVEAKRFTDKTLLPIESHTSADARSGRIGDIDVVSNDNRSFEAVEVKFRVNITLQLVLDAHEKFKTTPVNRYYILTTAEQPTQQEWEAIQLEITKIKNVHGCQLIVNGIMPSLKYYLRILENPSEFIINYTTLLESDTALKFEHKSKWNELISMMS